MADFGTIAIGFDPYFTAGQRNAIYPLGPLRKVRLFSPESFAEVLHAPGRDDTDGDPAPPCLRIQAGGSIRFQFPVAPGNRRLSVRCKETSTLVERPRLKVLRNDAIGVAADLVAVAPAGAEWNAVGPLEFPVLANGVVVVELISFRYGFEGDCRWDHFAFA